MISAHAAGSAPKRAAIRRALALRYLSIADAVCSAAATIHIPSSGTGACTTAGHITPPCRLLPRLCPDVLTCIYLPIRHGIAACRATKPIGSGSVRVRSAATVLRVMLPGITAGR